MPVLPGGEGANPKCHPSTPQRCSPPCWTVDVQPVATPVHSKRLLQHGHRGILGPFQLFLATLGAGLRPPTAAGAHRGVPPHPGQAALEAVGRDTIPKREKKGMHHSLWAGFKSQNLTWPLRLWRKLMGTAQSFTNLAHPGCVGALGDPNTHSLGCGRGQHPEQAELSAGTIPPKTPARGMRV